MEENMKIRKRSEIPVEDTWAIEDLYETDEVWEKELAEWQTVQEKLASYAGKLGENAQTLYDFLYLSEQTNVKARRLANYCMRKSDEDTREAKY